MKNSPIITYEFGTLYIEGQAHKEGDTHMHHLTVEEQKALRDAQAQLATRNSHRYSVL